MDTSVFTKDFNAIALNGPILDKVNSYSLEKLRTWIVSSSVNLVTKEMSPESLK